MAIGSKLSIGALILWAIAFPDAAGSILQSIRGTIAAAGDESPKGRIQIITWGVILTLVIGGLLLAGGLGAINTAMIIGALPFSSVMALMGVSLRKALWNDTRRAKQ